MLSTSQLSIVVAVIIILRAKFTQPPMSGASAIGDLFHFSINNLLCHRSRPSLTCFRITLCQEGVRMIVIVIVQGLHSQLRGTSWIRLLTTTWQVRPAEMRGAPRTRMTGIKTKSPSVKSTFLTTETFMLFRFGLTQSRSVSRGTGGSTSITLCLGI